MQPENMPPQSQDMLEKEFYEDGEGMSCLLMTESNEPKNMNSVIEPTK